MHQPVLTAAVLEQLGPRPGQDFIDATLGQGGHTEALLQRTSPRGRVMAFDADPAAVSAARQRLADYKDRVIFINDSYTKIKNKIYEHKYFSFSGVVCDLGYSSLQVEDKNRGFSYESEGTLDLRYSPLTAITADGILQTKSAGDLQDIFKRYGEEPLAGRIAKAIVAERKKTKITGEALRQIVEREYGRKWHTPSRIHPATRVWQALRIAVNDEWGQLEDFLKTTIAVMPSRSRLAVISFHSGEDRLVKQCFKLAASDCICPPSAPVCRCDHRAQIKLVTKKPIVPLASEVQKNPRSRSAKLRIVEKI